MTQTFKWNPNPASNIECALITVNGKTGMFRADGTVGVDEAAKKLGIAAGDIGTYLMYEDNGVEKYILVTSTIIPISDGVEYEVGYYKVTLSSSYAIKEDSDTADDGILYMKSNDTVRVKITSADDWNDWAPTFDKGFTFDEVDFGYDGSTTGYSEVDLTAPTLTNNVTVTVGSTART